MRLSSTYYPASTKQIFLGANLLDFENGHSPPSGTEATNLWRFAVSPPRTFLSTCTTLCMSHVMSLLMHCVQILLRNVFG